MVLFFIFFAMVQFLRTAEFFFLGQLSFIPLSLSHLHISLFSNFLLLKRNCGKERRLFNHIELFMLKLRRFHNTIASAFRHPQKGLKVRDQSDVFDFFFFK